MNRQKLIGVVASVVVAGLGTLVLLKYANSSKKVAVPLASEPTVAVLKVQRLVVKGTPAELLGDAVIVQQIPVSQKLNDAADNVALLTGLVASTDLLPNEQVVKARFIPAAEQKKQEVGAGAGLVGVWITLDPIRALNGRVKVNDTVAVFASFTGVPNLYPVPPEELVASPSVHLIVHKVVVLDVVGATPDTIPVAPGQATPPAVAPVAAIQIKLGLDAPAAERLVMASSFGQIWLGSEEQDVVETGTQIVDRSNVYKDTPKSAAPTPGNPVNLGVSTANPSTPATSDAATGPVATPVSATKPGAKTTPKTAAAASPAPAPAAPAVAAKPTVAPPAATPAPNASAPVPTTPKL